MESGQLALDCRFLTEKEPLLRSLALEMKTRSTKILSKIPKDDFIRSPEISNANFQADVRALQSANAELRRTICKLHFDLLILEPAPLPPSILTLEEKNTLTLIRGKLQTEIAEIDRVEAKLKCFQKVMAVFKPMVSMVEALESQPANVGKTWEELMKEPTLRTVFREAFEDVIRATEDIQQRVQTIDRMRSVSIHSNPPTNSIHSRIVEKDEEESGQSILREEVLEYLAEKCTKFKDIHIPF